MNKKLFSAMFLGSAIFPLAVSAFSFTQNLQLGDNNSDVKQLQIFLNKYPDMRVALSGVGSSGNESTYFGSLTLQAVERFQAKYSTNVLVPSGLSYPTGFVGPATIKEINSLSVNVVPVPAANWTATNNQTVTSSQNIQQLPVVSMPIISGLSKVSVNAGDTLVINGKFSGTSVVHFSDDAAVSSRLISPTEIDTVVPDTAGIFMVWVSNEYGDSRADFPMFISVNGAASPNDLSVITAQNNIIHNKALDPANQ